MKSLEHIIREIREGKAEKGDKKTLEGAIRKIMKGEKESSFADRTTKPITDDVGGLIGSGTGGEPKLHKEAIGVIGTDDYQGNQFKSVRTATPHIKPPAGAGSHSQAPENVSRQRTLAKEKSSMTLHGKVSEEEQIDELAPALAAVAAPYAAPFLGALGAGMAGYLATRGKGKLPSFRSYDPEKAKQNDSYGTAAERMKAMKFKPAEPTEKPKHDEPIPGVIPDPSKPEKAPEAPPTKPTEPEKAPPKPEEKPKAPPVTIPSPKPVEVPQEPPAKAIPAPKTPQPEIPPPLPAQTRPGKETKTTPKTPAPATPKELPATKPVELPAIDIPGVKTKPEVKPETKPDVKTDVDTKPKVAQLPAIDIGAKTKTAAATDTKTATQTAAVPAATTPKSAETTTTTGEADKKKLPGLGGASIPHEIDYTASHLVRPKVSVGHAKAHKKHAMRESEERKTIENMPRKGDRKTIEYVGKKDADPKTAKEKTSRLAIIKNVIDEAKKQVAKKTSYEDGKTKMFDYGDDVLIINPNQKRVDLDVEGNKIPKDYDNK